MSFECQFSKDIYNARMKQGWTQPYVAELLSVSVRTYQNIEHAKVIPRIKTFLKLIYLFELDIDDYREGLGIDIPVCTR